MNKLLGKRIKALRNAKKFTQEEISKQIGISRRKYARIENGGISITLDILFKIADILEVAVGDITKVLDETFIEDDRIELKGTSTEHIFEMLDLFYANKHMYERLIEVE